MASLPPNASPALQQSIEYQMAHVADDRRSDIVIGTAICLVLAYVAVALRFISRYLVRVAIQADDWLIIVGAVFTTAWSIHLFVLVNYGLGRHSILITDPSITGILTITAETCYNLCIIAVKCSILSLYGRLFPQRGIKRALWATAGFVSAYSVAQLFCDIFQCTPVAKLWNPLLDGTCLDFDSLILCTSIINTLTDVVILALPMPVLWHLKVSQTKKWMLLGTFLLGGFVCIISIVRLFFLKNINQLDPTWANVNGIIVTSVELSIGILSACLPTYRPLYNRLRYGSASVQQTKLTGGGVYASQSHELSKRGGGIAMPGKAWTGAAQRDLRRSSEDGVPIYTRLGGKGEEGTETESGGESVVRVEVVSAKIGPGKAGKGEKGEGPWEGWR